MEDSVVEAVKETEQPSDFVGPDGDLEDLRHFKARLKEIGVSDEEVEKIEAIANGEAGEGLSEAVKKMICQLIENFREGSTIDPVYYPRDKDGKFTGRNPWTWKKGMKSPNPLGKARTHIGLWGRFCQIMALTPDDVKTLLERTDLTLADRAAIVMGLKVANDGAWPQQLEVIQREEGKVQEKVQIETPPAPIRFTPSPSRAQPELLEEDTSETEAEEG